jgi:hypothetical protein
MEKDKSQPRITKKSKSKWNNNRKSKLGIS